MATPHFLMDLNTSHTMQEATPTHFESSETKPETSKNKAKKSTKSNSPSQKKQPQRGMGVAQLERLRLQERRKKMTEMNPLQYSLYINHHYQTPHSLVPNDTSTTPFSTAANIYGVPMIGGGDKLGLNGVLMGQKVGNEGGVHRVGGGEEVQVGSVCRVGALMDDQRFWVGNGNVFEASKELSSMPNMHSFSDQFKKKRVNGLYCGFDGERNKYVEGFPVDGYDFLGLNLENNQNSNGYIRDFCAATRYLDKEIEITAIHREVNSVGGRVLMEYKFFPSKGCDGGTSYKESKCCAEASSAVAGEASFTTASTITNTSSFVDLSLKL